MLSYNTHTFSVLIPSEYLVRVPWATLKGIISYPENSTKGRPTENKEALCINMRRPPVKRQHIPSTSNKLPLPIAKHIHVFVIGIRAPLYTISREKIQWEKHRKRKMKGKSASRKGPGKSHLVLMIDITPIYGARAPPFVG